MYWNFDVIDGVIKNQLGKVLFPVRYELKFYVIF
jgi:hypothetical protein